MVSNFGEKIILHGLECLGREENDNCKEHAGPNHQDIKGPRHELAAPMMVYTASPFIGPEIGPLYAVTSCKKSMELTQSVGLEVLSINIQPGK